MHSCTVTDLPLVLPGSPLFSPPQACNPPPTSTAPTPLPRVTTTHPVQLIPLRQRCQIIVLLWSRIPGCWPRPARRSTHSRPRRASTLSPLPPLLLLETQLPVLTMMLCSSLVTFVHFDGWAGLAARTAACQGCRAGLGCQSESEQCSAAEAKRPPLRGCCSQTSGIYEEKGP